MMIRIPVILFAVLAAFAPCTNLYSQTLNAESAIRQYFQNSGQSRMSGSGVYLHETYKKAVKIGQVADGIEFQNIEHLERFLQVIAGQSGIDFGLKHDQQIQTLEKLWIDREKVRKDVALLSPEQVSSIRHDRVPVIGLQFSTYAYDGGKTVALTEDGPKGRKERMATLSNNKIAIPKFHQFGLNDSGKEASVFLDALDNGQANITGFTKNGKIHATYTLVEMGIRVEFVLLPDKDMSLERSTFYMGDHLVTETICENYKRSQSGFWSPGRYTIRKYALLGGTEVLTYSDSFQAIADTVDFNIPIENSTFSPVIPIGTYVMDTRTSPMREYIIEELPSSDLSSPEFLAPASIEEIGTSPAQTLGEQNHRTDSPPPPTPTSTGRGLNPLFSILAVLAGAVAMMIIRFRWNRRSTRLKVIGFILPLVILAEAGAATGPQLVTEETVTGNVYVDYSRTFQIPLRNDGDAVLKIKSIQTSCGCTVVGDYVKFIEPGQSLIIPIRYTPTKRSGTFAQQVLILTNDIISPVVRVSINGNIVESQDFACSVTKIEINSLVGETVRPRRTVRLSSVKLLTEVQITSSPKDFEVGIHQVNPMTVDIVVEAPVGTPRRIIEDTIKFTFYVNEQFREVEIPVRYEVRNRISVYPESIFIGTDTDQFYSRIMVKTAENPLQIEEVSVKGVEGVELETKRYNDKVMYIYMSGAATLINQESQMSELQIKIMEAGVSRVIRVPIKMRVD